MLLFDLCLVLVEARFITNKLEIFVFSLLLTNLRNIGVFFWWSDDRILCWINLALSFSVGKFCIRPSTSLAVMDLFKLLTSSTFTLIGQTYLGIHPFLFVSQLEGKWILKAFTNGFLKSLSVCSYFLLFIPSIINIGMFSFFCLIWFEIANIFKKSTHGLSFVNFFSFQLYWFQTQFWLFLPLYCLRRLLFFCLQELQVHHQVIYLTYFKFFDVSI